MQMKVTLILALIVVLIVGCATTKKYESVLDTWLNSDINSLIESWGYPDNSFEAPNGNMVYVYSRSGQVTLPSQTTSNYNIYGNTVYGSSTTTGGQTIKLGCTTFFEVNQGNRIIKYRYEGNNCKSR